MTESRNSAGFTHREVLVIIAGLLLSMFLAALDQTIISTALPQIARDVGGSSHLSWVIAAYLLTSTASTPIYGKLSDFYGRKIMLQIAVSAFIVTSVLCALAATMNQLIVFRALQGLGGGGLIALAHTTIADIVSPRERGRYQAYFATTFGTASIVGPILGGFFADQLSWRWVFWINLPLGIAALAMSEKSLRRLVTRRVRHRIDYLGAALIVATICSLLLVTTMGGNDAAWDSPLILGLTAATFILLGLATWRENRAKEPILPPHLFRNRIFVIMAAGNVLTALLMFGSIVFLPLFIQLVFAQQAMVAGLILMPFMASSAFGAISNGRIMTRTGRYKVLAQTGCAIFACGFLALSFMSTATPLWAVALVLFCQGFSTGLLFPVLMVATQNSVDPRDMGTATASMNCFRSIGGSFGVTLFSAILIAALNYNIGAIPGLGFLGDNPGTAVLHAGDAVLQMVAAGAQSNLANAIKDSFHLLFRVAAAIALLVFVGMSLMKEEPLRTTMGTKAIDPKAKIDPAT